MPKNPYRMPFQKEYLVEWLRKLNDKVCFIFLPLIIYGTPTSQVMKRRHWKAIPLQNEEAQPREVPAEAAVVLDALGRVNMCFEIEQEWWARQRELWNASAMPAAVHLPQLKTVEYRQACDTFRRLHLDAWRTVDTTREIVDQSDLPPAVSRVLRAYRGKRSCSEGHADPQVTS